MLHARRFLRATSTALALQLTAAALPTIAHADVQITEEARQHFKAGVNLLNDPDGPRYEEAYREFKAAYAASPSYKILGNLGLCAMKLERDGEAIDAYEKYLAEGGKEIEANERAQVQTDLTTLKTGAVKVKLTISPPDASIIDARIPVKGDQVVNTYQADAKGVAEIKVRSGRHVFTVKANGYETQTWEVDAAAGSTQQKEIKLQKPTVVPTAPTGPTGPTPPTTVATRPIPTSFWIATGAAGVLVVGGAITGAMALGKHSDYDKQNGVDANAADKLRKDGRTLNLVTDVLLGGAVVAAGVATFLYASRPTVEVPAKDRGSRFVAPVVGANGGGVVFVTTF
ncbi:MAG: hypothetical protein ACXVEE_01395 [Polyangiales bacterium]